MSLLKQIHLLTEDDDAKKVDKAPLFKGDEKAPKEKEAAPEEKPDEEPAEPESTEEPEQKPEETSDEPSEEAPKEDVGTVVADQGFEKDSREMFAFGKTRKVTVLTKTEPLGGLEITYQYLINPKTGSWTLRACLKGQSDEDMVEFHKGEDPTSLIDSLKKSERITPEQAVNNLNPPADPKAE